MIQIICAVFADEEYDNWLFVCSITLSLITASLLSIIFAAISSIFIGLFLFCWIIIISDIFGFFCQLSFIFWIPNNNFIGYGGIFGKFLGDIFIYKLYYILLPFCIGFIFDAIISGDDINIWDITNSIDIN